MASDGIDDDRAPRSARALVFVAAHLGFALCLQLELLWLHLRQPGDSLRASLELTAAVPFLQLENLVVAGLLGLVAALCETRWLRFVPYLALLAVDLWLVVDQVAFGVFFTHLDLSASEVTQVNLETLERLRDSFLAVAGRPFALNLALALLVQVIVLSSRPGRALGRVRRSRRLAAGLALWVASCLAVTATVDGRGVQHHAVVALLRSALARSSAPPRATLSESAVRVPIFDAEPPAASDDAALAQALVNLRARRRRPNVLLVILESVGSIQLSPDGHVSRLTTPAIAHLLERGVHFPAVYTTFPGSLRSQVNLQSGGRTITWGGAWDELTRPYRGPTLPSTFAALGYRTAFFTPADLAYEQMDRYMATLGFDELRQTGTEAPAWKTAHHPTSWGTDDDSYETELMAFFEGARAEGRPGFAEYFTCATHHAYSAPPGWPGPFGGDDPFSRYRNALNAADAFVGRVVADLARRGLLESTIIAFTGDHGEAFGDRHPRNLVHRNAVYDENVRTFLSIVAPGALEAPVTSPRIASNGDILPTLLRAAGVETLPGDLAGQSLWPGDYHPRTVFFHKNTQPERWGLRDGRWKFSAARVGEPDPELFDLSVDPFERENLAVDAPERTAIYARRCAEWYSLSDECYVSRLGGEPLFKARPTSFGSDTTAPGPKYLEVGVAGAGGADESRPWIGADETPVAFTVWGMDSKDRTLVFRWSRPDGGSEDSHFRLDHDWTRTRTPYPGKRPLAAGTWRVAILEHDRELIAGSFEVRERPAPVMPKSLWCKGCPGFRAMASHRAEDLVPRTLGLLLATALLSLGASALAGTDHVYDVKTFGAKGDGVTNDTLALQAAIDSCTQTGGTVSLHDGVFLSGMITLRSNVHFTIEGGATLKGTQNDADYPETNPHTDNSQLHNCRKTLVYAEGASNVTIDGTGTIDGSGNKPEWLGSSKVHPERTRPMAIYIVQSDNVLIQDLTVKDAAMWGVVNLETDHLKIEHLNVHSPFGGTRDGIDVVDCHHVLVENCTIFSEDDSICLKSGAARGCDDIMVRKNHVRQSTVANGLKLGTASRGGFSNVTFEDCLVENCDKAAMAVESVDGAAISNITFRGIQVHNAGTAVFVLLGLRSGTTVGSIDSVTFENVQADKMKHSWGSVISGTVLDGKTYPVRNIVFKNVNLAYKGKLTSIPADPPEYQGQYPDPNLWGSLPAAGLYLRHVQGATLHETTIKVHPHDARSAVVERDVSGVTR